MLITVQRWRVRQLGPLLAAMVRIARAEIREALQRGAPLPAIYASGVVYRREPPPLEEWTTPEETIRRGWGDCEDLAIWRAAELQESGEDPDAIVAIKRSAGAVWHAQVRRGSGEIEDPSLKLGMKAS